MKRERRYLCAYFPEWSIDVTKRGLNLKGLEHEPQALLLTRTESNQLVISRCCQNAAKAGVTFAMPLPLAQALCPNARVESFDPLRDTQALHTLARWCLRFSPLVGLDRELLKAKHSETLETTSSLHYGITIDLTGTERIHRDLSALCTELHDLFKKRARIALTPTIGCSWALSRFGRSETPILVSSLQQIPSAIASLPPHALRVDDSCIKRLDDLGITFLSDLLRLPRYTLAQRFGKLLVYRLEQILGEAEEALGVIETPRRYARSRIFEPPLTNRRAISRSIQYLFQSLLTQLRRDKRAAAYFKLTIRDTTDQAIFKEFPLASAISDPAYLHSIIEPIIEGLTFFGEVRELSLDAQQIEETTSEQQTFSAHDRSTTTERARNELMNNFSLRIGKDRVTIAKLHTSYIPERSFSYESALTPAHSVSVMQPIAPYNLEERPSVLLPQPEPVSTIAMLPDKPPSMIQWRGVRLSIISGFGPERIAPEWWRSDLQSENFAERDYFKVQDELGRWLWIYRDQGSQRWFLHGIWS